MTRKPRPAADAARDPSELLRPLADSRGLVLGVSGGPDSTALMVLVAGWQAAPPAIVVSVDHGLRPEAAGETRLVAENARKLGLPCRVMRASGRPAGGNLQDWARRARYECLVIAAKEAGFDTIVTAHHTDDQAETFLLRLARGSGVYGLAGMAEESTVQELRLMRPLLGVPRRVLGEIAAASGLQTTDDPSNRDARFDRVRLRSLMPALATHGLTPKRLADTAGRLGRAAAALDHYCAALLKEHFPADPFGVVGGATAPLAAVPEEVGLRALALISRAVGGADYTPRLESVETLMTAIVAAAEHVRVRRTLNGALIDVEGGRLTARREWGRNGPTAVPVPAGSAIVWDRRFRVSVPDLPGRLTIGPLGASPRRLLSNQVDRTAMRTLPGLFDGGELVALPRGVAVEGDPLGSFRSECIVDRRLRASPEFTTLQP